MSPSTAISIALFTLGSLLSESCARPTVAEEMREGRAFAPLDLDGGPGQVTIHIPASLRTITGTATDPSGKPLDISCGTCHSTFVPTLPDSATHVAGPHAGLEFKHGTNVCASCHDPAQPAGLHLSTGEHIPLTDAIRVCAQCHGPQYTNYQHGAHGGMTGYWDLQRGARTRNHCVDCHDPHTPRFPTVMPLLLRPSGRSGAKTD